MNQILYIKLQYISLVSVWARAFAEEEMQGSWSHFHWGINCLSFAAEKQRVWEVADVPERRVFWLFHNVDAKGLLPFHRASLCCSVLLHFGSVGFYGILWQLMVCFLLFELWRLVYVPEGFCHNEELQPNLPCLWIQAIIEERDKSLG